MKKPTMSTVIDLFRGRLHFDGGTIEARSFRAEFSAHGARVLVVARRDGVLFANVGGCSAVVGQAGPAFVREVMASLREVRRG